MGQTTLTYTQGSSYATPSTTPTDQQGVDTVNTAISAATHWRGVSSGAGYLLIGGKVGGPMENFRALITINPTAGYMSPDTTGSAIYVMIAPPSAVTRAAPTLGTYNSSTPFGSDRVIGYWRCCATGVAESVWIEETADTLDIYFKDDSTGAVYGCGFGAIITSPADQTGNCVEVDGKIYGLYTSGSTNIFTAFWASSSQFLTHNGSAGQAHFAIFKPSSPTTVQTVTRCMPTIDTTTTVDLNGKLNHLPIYIYNASAPAYLIGKLRQRGAVQDYACRTVLTDSNTSTVKAYCVSQSNSPSTADTLSFTNG